MIIHRIINVERLQQQYNMILYIIMFVFDLFNVVLSCVKQNQLGLHHHTNADKILLAKFTLLVEGIITHGERTTIPRKTFLRNRFIITFYVRKISKLISKPDWGARFFKYN
jgi:hypothetical protein